MSGATPQRIVWRQSENEMSLDTGGVRLRFTLGRMLVLSEFSCPALGNVAADLAGVGDTWKVAFRGPDGTAPEYSPLFADFLGADFQEDGSRGEIVLRWHLPLSRKGGAEVRMRIGCEAGSARLAWRLHVKVPDGWKVTGAEFPILPGLLAEKLPRAAVPTSWGTEYDLVSGVRYIGQYPSWEAGMQMAAFYGHGHGLYIGAHDPAACLKNLCLEAQAGVTRFSFLHFPSIPEEAGKDFELPFETITQFFDGDYTDAGRIYRAFTFETPWGNTPPVSKRTIPRWMQDADIWLRPDGSPADNLDITKKALAYFGTNTATHWYRWHEIPYDTNYPEYFPPLPGFGEAIRALHDAGTHVIPYINGRLWDPDSKSWREKEAWRGAARKENGDCYTEVYGSHVPNTAMCPWSALWREELASLIQRFFDELDTAGVYIDQICAARGVPCFNPDHGHPLGGGGAWHEGYRTLLEGMRKRVPEGRVLTTEECAEPWLDLFDAMIILNMPAELHSIPLFPSVYSDRTIGYAFLYYAKDEPRNSFSFRWKNSRAFLYGAQVGWIQPDRIMAPEVSSEAEFLRDLARTRSHARPFVTDGQFLRLLDVAGDNTLLRGRGTGVFGPDYTIEEPAVNASAWLADGKPGVLLSNISSQDRSVKVPLPLDDAGIPAGTSLTATVFGPGGEITRETMSSDTLALTVPAGKALVVHIRPAGPS